MSQFRLIVGTFLVFTLLAIPVALANDFGHVKSGLLLGIYASPEQGGMKVQQVIPGYSAQGRLFPGDVLMRATIDGAMIYSLRSLYEMENAKTAIGANQQAAVEIYRPGSGYLYAWVEFTPITSPTAAYSTQSKAMFRMESEQTGARDMFRSNQGPADRSVELPRPGFNSQNDHPQPLPFVPETSSGRSAANLFGK
jgi:hypothetical protein